MIHDFQTAEHDVSWLAIRQPAVMRLLEAELAAGDGDAFAAGLELACRVLGGRTPLGDLRLDHHALAAGLAAVRSGRCDRAMVRSLRDQIDAAGLPTMLEVDGGVAPSTAREVTVAGARVLVAGSAVFNAAKGAHDLSFEGRVARYKEAIDGLRARAEGVL